MTKRPCSLGLLLSCFAAVLLNACGMFKKDPGIFVPDLPSPREQFSLAQAKERDLMLATENSPNYQNHLREVTASYEKLIHRYPDDRSFTPWARIRLSQLSLSQSKHGDAMRIIQGVLDDYGDLHGVDAKARYVKGRILEKQGKKLEAQEVYRACMEKYKDSEDEVAKRAAKDCQKLYERVLAIGKE